MMNNSIWGIHVEGSGKVILKMTSDKELTLKKMPQVPDICKNQVSGSLLSKNDFDKFILTKNEMFVGKRYMSDGLFKLNVMTIVPIYFNNKNEMNFSYLLESRGLCSPHLIQFLTLRHIL